jgi:hypothetical protein
MWNESFIIGFDNHVDGHVVSQPRKPKYELSSAVVNLWTHVLFAVLWETFMSIQFTGVVILYKELVQYSDSCGPDDWVSFLGVTRPEREAHLSPVSSAEV